MNNSKKSNIFRKKQTLNIGIFICVAIALSLVIYFTNVPVDNSTSQVNNNETKIAQNGSFDNELDINEKSKDNAVQVNNQDKVNKTELTEEVASNNVDNTKSNIDNSANTNNLDKGESQTISQKDESKVSLNESSNSSDVVEKASQDEEIAQVSSTGNITFSSPLEGGTLIREYTTDTIYSKTLNTWRTREGVDLKAENGTPVVSILDGVVEKIDNDLTEKGQYIVIKHDNGFKSVYTNLDEEVKVVNGQHVRKGEIIASVGDSSGNYSNEDYGAHLNFIMYLNNEEVDPAEYIKFE